MVPKPNRSPIVKMRHQVVKASGIFPRWDQMKAEEYNRTTNVDWCFLRWGSLDEPIESPQSFWGEFGGRDCILRRVGVLPCPNLQKTERRVKNET